MVLFLCENSNRWSTKLVTPNLAQNLLSQTDLEANEEVCCVQYYPQACFACCPSISGVFVKPSHSPPQFAGARPRAGGYRPTIMVCSQLSALNFPYAKIFPQFWVKICNLCSLALPIVLMHRIWFCTTRAKASARQEVSFPRKWRAGTPSSLSPVRTLTFMWLVAYTISLLPMQCHFMWLVAYAISLLPM